MPNRLIASRLTRNLALALLMALLLVRIPFSGVHMGLARDFFVAYRIVHGAEFPLYGPVLNETIHLGPVWFYLLAALLAIGRSWLPTLLLLGLLAALQVPLAYLLGKALHSRRAGLLFAVGLLVPNWSTFEWLLPSHPLLSLPLDLAFALCAVRYCKRPRTRYLAAMALLGVLAIHAHPANAGLVWIGLGAMLWAWRQGALRLRDVATAAVLALLPLLPFFYWDASLGFAELGRATAYLGNESATGRAFDVVGLFTGVAWGGTREWFAPTLGWPSLWADAAAAVVATGGAAGAIGLVFAVREARTQRVIACSAAALLAMLATTTLLRAATPYYMAASIWFILAGLVAIGLAALGETRLARTVRAGVVAVSLGACLLTLAGNAKFQASGTWTFEWLPLFDIKSARAGNAETLPLMPAYAQRKSGRFLCEQSGASIHGAYATQLASDQAIAMRLACGRSDVEIGGADAARQHWLGLSRAMFEHLGAVPAHRIGSIGLIAARPLGDAAGFSPPDAPVYPAQIPAALEGDRVLTLHLGASERLAISKIGYGLTELPTVTVRMNGRSVAPSVSDAFVAVYACAVCEAGAGVEVEVDLRGGNSRGVDLVAF